MCKLRECYSTETLTTTTASALNITDAELLALQTAEAERLEAERLRREQVTTSFHVCKLLSHVLQFKDVRNKSRTIPLPDNSLSVILATLSHSYAVFSPPRSIVLPSFSIPVNFPPVVLHHGQFPSRLSPSRSIFLPSVHFT